MNAKKNIAPGILSSRAGLGKQRRQLVVQCALQHSPGTTSQFERWTKPLQGSVHLRFRLQTFHPRSLGPVLILDEAQEALTQVLTELRVLASKELDSRQLLCVVFAGDSRLVDRFRTPELQPLGSRIRRRLTLDYASRDELLACLDHLRESAGSPTLMTTELKSTLADHAAGNYRVLMNLSDELLAAAAERELPRLDEKLFLDTFNQQHAKPAKAAAKRR